MEKFEAYVYVMVETDHMPLETICQKSLATAYRRLQRMLLTLQKCGFIAIHFPGIQMPDSGRKVNQNLYSQMRINMVR